MAGVVLIGLYRAAGWMLLWHRVRRCTAPALAAWEQLVVELRGRMGMARSVAVLLRGFAAVPGGVWSVEASDPDSGGGGGGVAGATVGGDPGP